MKFINLMPHVRYRWTTWPEGDYILFNPNIVPLEEARFNYYKSDGSSFSYSPTILEIHGDLFEKHDLTDKEKILIITTECKRLINSIFMDKRDEYPKEFTLNNLNRIRKIAQDGKPYQEE